MKTKEQRQQELRNFKLPKDNTPLGQHKVGKANTYTKPKNPHIDAFHLISDTSYDDLTKDSLRMKKLNKLFKTNINKVFKIRAKRKSRKARQQLRKEQNG